eukprot:TRINITY_DN10337_c0_g1_i1.p1 TRINITY_DN10337_c0_g1~~TRINITY_DN10337_c0_g1_i1.p1  ORF type:complete len:214 (-),score=27.73 TRINITY_DN10337_c0_g1_i1:2-643(-)
MARSRKFSPTARIKPFAVVTLILILLVHSTRGASETLTPEEVLQLAQIQAIEIRESTRKAAELISENEKGLLQKELQMERETVKSMARLAQDQADQILAEAKEEARSIITAAKEKANKAAEDLLAMTRLECSKLTESAEARRKASLEEFDKMIELGRKEQTKLAQESVVGVSSSREPIYASAACVMFVVAVYFWNQWRILNHSVEMYHHNKLS